MKIDFLIIGSFGGGALAITDRLAKAFEDLGYTAAVISYAAENHRALCEAGVKSFDFASETLSWRPPAPLPDLIDRFTRTLPIVSFRHLCFVEAQYTYQRPEALFSRAACCLSVSEKFFESHEIGCCILGPGGELGSRAARAFCRAKDIPTIYLGGELGLIHHRMILHSDENCRLEDYIYTPPEQIGTEERENIATLLENIRERRKVLAYDDHNDLQSRGSSRWSSLRRSIATRDWYRLECAVRVNWELQVGGRIRSWLAAPHYRRAIPAGNYVFFPLHHHIDSQITIRNPEFFDQTWLVEYVARCLPEGYTLAVKGHPGVPQLHLKDLRRMAGIPNVALLDPGLNAHDLIRGAKAIVNINSTVGFEALAYAKPVVVIGHWTLKNLGITFDVERLCDFSAVLRTALDAGGVDREKVLAVIHSLWKSMCAGSLWDSPADYAQVARSLVAKAERIRVAGMQLVR